MRAGVLLLVAASIGAAADAPSRYAKLDGARVHYKSYGSGRQAVVFIHGWTCDLTFWRLQAPVYDKHRSLLIDLPGHGQSDKPEIAYTPVLFARGIDAVMRDAGVDRAVLVGHSMGGPVALMFLKMFPQKAAGVVLVDAFIPPKPKTEEEKQKGSAQMAQMTQMLRAPDYREQVAKMIDSMFSPAAPPALREEVKSTMLAAPQYVRLSAFENMIALVNESFPPAKVPALAIRVKNNVRPGEEERVRELLPDLDAFQVWDGLGHFLMMEAPAKFNAALEGFLAKHGGRL